jgi:hypothetical protein
MVRTDSTVDERVENATGVSQRRVAERRRRRGNGRRRFVTLRVTIVKIYVLLNMTLRRSRTDVRTWATRGAQSATGGDG